MLFGPLLTAIALLPASDSCAANAQDSKYQFGDLGVSFDSLYFKKGEVNPHVAFKVEFDTLLGTLLIASKREVLPSKIKEQLSKAVADKKSWRIYKAYSNEDLTCQIQAIEPIGTNGSVVILLRNEVSYNDSFVVAFDYSSFMGDTTQSAATLGYLFHGADGKAKPISFRGRFTFELGGSGIPAEVTLITSDPDGAGGLVFRKSAARHFDISLTYKGSLGPFTGILKNGYSELQFKSTLSELSLDKESAIAFGYRELIGGYCPPGSATITGVRLSTSQSLNTTFLVASYGIRYGDARAEDRRKRETTYDAPNPQKDKDFVSLESVKDDIYFELAAEGGYAHFKEIKDVEREDLTTPWIWRGRATLGFTEIKTSRWSLSGEGSAYFLPHGSSGALGIKETIVPYVSATLGFRTSDSSTAAISYTFGNNPDARFTRIAPKLTLKIVQKF